MLTGKGVTIATPFLFKALVDTLPLFANPATPPHDLLLIQQYSFLPESLLASTALEMLPSLPLLLLLGYGTTRALTSAFQEYRNALFAL
jgi:hypothetical protein